MRFKSRAILPGTLHMKNSIKKFSRFIEFGMFGTSVACSGQVGYRDRACRAAFELWLEVVGYSRAEVDQLWQ